MMKLAVVLLAAVFVALASAQNSTTVIVDDITCESLIPNSACYVAEYEDNEVGEFCGYCRESDGTVHVFGCEDDARCTVDLTLSPPHGVCRAFTVKEIGQPCDPTSSNEVCHEDHYDVQCITNGNNARVCGGDHVYGPGQACGLADMDATVLEDGDGCAYGDCVSSVCEGAASGASCDVNHCNAGLYCNENEVCAARVAIGAACTRTATNGNDETDGDNGNCVANADCIDGTCVEYYSQAVGGKCGVVGGYYNQHVCDIDLACSYRSTSAYTCIELPNEGNGCDVTNVASCGDYYTCVCNYREGTGVCVGTQNRVGEALREGYRCLVENNCWFDLNWFIEGCVEEDCGSEAEAVVKELEHAAREVSDLTGVPADSAASFASVSAVVLAAAVAVALVL